MFTTEFAHLRLKLLELVAPHGAHDTILDRAKKLEDWLFGPPPGAVPAEPEPEAAGADAVSSGAEKSVPQPEPTTAALNAEMDVRAAAVGAEGAQDAPAAPSATDGAQPSG